MYLDPEVARRKFAREVERVQKQQEVLQSWGCWIVRAVYPCADAVFVPRKPLRLTLPTKTAPNQGLIVLAHQAPTFVHVDLGMLAARAFGIRVNMADFDRRAPSVSFHDPFTWDPVPFQQLPLGQNVDEHGKALQVVLDGHPATGRPFLCMRGVREYHEHPQHTGDDWALYRGHYGLFTVLSVVWRTCVEHAQPTLVFNPGGGLQVQWRALQDP